MPPIKKNHRYSPRQLHRLIKLGHLHVVQYCNAGIPIKDLATYVDGQLIVADLMYWHEDDWAIMRTCIPEREYPLPRSTHTPTMTGSLSSIIVSDDLFDEISAALKRKGILNQIK